MDTSCDASLVVAGPLRVDIKETPESFDSNEIFSTVKINGPLDADYHYIDDTIEEYTYYCHRYGGNIFDNPGVFLFPEEDFNVFVEEHDFSSAIQGENCLNIAMEAAEQRLPAVDPECLYVVGETGAPASSCEVSAEIVGPGPGNREGRLRILQGIGTTRNNCARGQDC